MSLIGKEYIVKDASKLYAFPIQVGDVVKVLEDFKSGCFGSGATSVEVYHNGKVTPLKISKFSAYWCFFSQGMINSGELVEVNFGETDHLLEGKNGDRLMESVDRIRSKLAVQSYLHAYGVESLEDRYNNWIVENIHVYELFCEFAIKAIQSGKKRISHWLIVNRLRWEVEIETKGTCYQDKDFKISNDYIAFLARDFMKDYPQYGEVFKIKQMKRV